MTYQVVRPDPTLALIELGDRAWFWSEDELAGAGAAGWGPVMEIIYCMDQVGMTYEQACEKMREMRPEF